MSNNITPFVKRMRTQGGTFYTFSSAVEDIGININEKTNVVEMSNFALLDIPKIGVPDNINQNRFNTFGIEGSFQNYEVESGNIKDGRIVIAESFQNYALNLESNLLNRPEYNPVNLKSVSERVLWKWLKETGAIRWAQDASNPEYYIEDTDTDTSTGYNSVVKYIGKISAGSVRSDNFGTYNETYILIPTSHGQTKVYFNQNYDDNYTADLEIGAGYPNILGREGYTKPHPDGLSLLAQYDHADSSNNIIPEGDLGPWNLSVDTGSGYNPGWWYNAQGKNFTNPYYYITDTVASQTDVSTYGLNYKLSIDNVGDPSALSAVQYLRSNVDALEIEYDISNLRNIFGDDTLTYDKMAIEEAVDTTFNFNAVLVYYSIYNKTRETKLATNLLGILFLDPASGNTAGFPDVNIEIPSLSKLQSVGNGFGSSYSFRLNIKSDNMMDDTQATIVDESTSAQASVENWSDVFASLSKSLSLMNQNSSTINYITQQYLNISSIQSQQGDIITDLQYQINDTISDIKGTNNTIALFAEGDDPLVDSSIYMRLGKIGMFNKDPKYDLHLDGELKATNIIIEDSIKDASSDTILRYETDGSIHIGSIAIDRSLLLHTGNPTPSGVLDVSGNFYAAGTVYAPSAMPSDIKLKDNVITLENPLNKVLALDGVNFNWKHNGQLSAGFIAQEVEKLIPEVVETYRAIDGSINKSIRYDEIIPYLVESIKLQQEEINKLKNKIQ